MVTFVFVHSYSSDNANWRDVMLGNGAQSGRLTRGRQLAHELGVPLLANDKVDQRNRELFSEGEVTNMATAKNSADEVSSALRKAAGQPVMFVTSPDHLPRVVKEVMIAGGENCLFAASDIAFSESGAAGVMVIEPPHSKTHNRGPQL
ncbi:MAG: hypothetical protein ABJK25_14140 [Halieaceae bacterium]